MKIYVVVSGAYWESSGIQGAYTDKAKAIEEASKFAKDWRLPEKSELDWNDGVDFVEVQETELI